MRDKISRFLIWLAVRISPDFYRWNVIRSRQVRVVLSSHAIDRASQKCLGIWWDTREGDDGIDTWLRKQVVIGMNAHGLKSPITVGKIQFFIEKTETLPVVTTVYPVTKAVETPIKVCEKIKIV